MTWPPGAAGPGGGAAALHPRCGTARAPAETATSRVPVHLRAPGRTGPFGAARPGAAREQPGRGRPWTADSMAAADARTPATGHAFAQNPRRGRYGIADGPPDQYRLGAAFDDLALTTSAKHPDHA